MGFGINLGMGLGIGSNILPNARPVLPFTFSEIINTDGASITTTNVGPLTIEVKATSYQVNPIEDGYIKVNSNTIKVTTLGSRGHTLAVLNSNGSTVGSIVTYDTTYLGNNAYPNAEQTVDYILYYDWAESTLAERQGSANYHVRYFFILYNLNLA